MFDFCRKSRFVELSPEVWRLAVDATLTVTDAWQAARALMGFSFTPSSSMSQVRRRFTHMRDVLRDKRGVSGLRARDDRTVPVLKIPALYVSGYLATETASATHAWGNLNPRRGLAHGPDA